MNVALNEPVVEVVTVAGDVVTVVPSYLTVIEDEAAKPVPDTVTFEPVILFVGLTLIDELTVNVAEELSEATSIATIK